MHQPGIALKPIPPPHPLGLARGQDHHLPPPPPLWAGREFRPPPPPAVTSVSSPRLTCASTASRFRSLRLISMFPSNICHCSPATLKADIFIESAWGHFHRVATRPEPEFADSKRRATKDKLEWGATRSAFRREPGYGRLAG